MTDFQERDTPPDERSNPAEDRALLHYLSQCAASLAAQNTTLAETNRVLNKLHDVIFDDKGILVRLSLLEHAQKEAQKEADDRLHALEASRSEAARGEREFSRGQALMDYAASKERVWKWLGALLGLAALIVSVLAWVLG